VRDRPAVPERIGRALYERLLRADPCPGDLEWSELTESDREVYRTAAEVVVRHYEAAMGYPEADL
jgi:hypothetical protein